jgi:hypothetical protein
MNTASTTRFLRLVNFVEPYLKRPLENDVQAVTRMLYARAKSGWEVVDMCRDEMHIPSLIYKRTDTINRKPNYLIEEIRLDESKGELDSIIHYLNERAKDNWLPSCILETVFYPPIAVMQRSTQTSNVPVRFKAHPLALELFGRRTNYIANQLFELQSKEHLKMACLIRNGLNPVLLMSSMGSEEPFDYMVDHAFGGFYRNQTTTLSDLITERSEEGWHVCGAFQDVFEWPCVIFKRETISKPMLPDESA